MIYLDNSSTTRQAEEVTEVMRRVALETFGNPSSLHDLGLSAEHYVRSAREGFARLIGADPEEITFNSCGTEGDNTVLFGAARAGRKRRKNIVTTQVEHPAVLEACKVLAEDGFEIRYLPVDGLCRVDPAAVEALTDEDTILVSMMAVNNEAGTILPIREAAGIAHRAGALFHSDAVQALGKIDLKQTGADFLTVSAHKVHGPKGIGALYMKKGVTIPPFLVGGGQEHHFRSGTENVPGIAGFGEACRLLAEDMAGGRARMAAARERLRTNLQAGIPDLILNSPDLSEDDAPGSGVCSVLNVSFPGTRGEVLLHTLEQDEIYVSTGSACSSNKTKKAGSHVLRAMGRSPKEIEGAVRFSFSRYNTTDEMDTAAQKIEDAVKRFRRLGSFR